MDSPEKYDVLILGTSLRNSVLAAALSIAGSRVIHIDANEWYGANNASISPPFSLDGLEDVLTSFSVVEGPHIALLGMAKSYNIELSPKLLYANSRMVQVLRDIGIGDYVEFKALSAFYLSNQSGLVQVPASKEDIFTSISMALVTKRRLMKFIKFCSDYTTDSLYEQHKTDKLVDFLESRFRLDADLINASCYALGQASTIHSTVGETIPTIHAHLHSLGMFGAFPVVIPMYGAGSELTQAFCRKAAVKGCTYALGEQIGKKTDFPSILGLQSGHQFEALHTVRDGNRRGDGSARRFLIVEGESHDLMRSSDGLCVVIQPQQGDEFVIHCQVHGSSLGVCPSGQSVIYFHSDANCSWEQFDTAQAQLLKQLACKLIIQVQYKLVDDTSWTSYDDLINDAEEIFHTLVGPDMPFLPSENPEEQDEV